MRFNCFFWALFFGGSPLAISTESFDEGKPYGRVAVFVADAQQERRPLNGPVRSAPGQHLVIFADASAHCQLLVVAISSKQQILSTFTPALAELNGINEIKLLDEREWNQDEGLQNSEIRAYFFAFDNPQLPALCKLISAMRAASNKEPALLAAQAARLRECLAKASRPLSEAEQFTTTKPPSVGGVFRGGQEDWRRFSRRANFSSAQPGIVSFRAAPQSPAQ